MKKVNNPYEGMPEHGCFCCSSKNPIGLKLNFWFDENNQTLETRWIPEKKFQGYSGVLHGGIQSTIMDEVASWCVYVLEGTAGVTHSMEIFFKKPVMIEKGQIVVRGRVTKREKRLVTIAVDLFDGEGAICTSGNIHYFVFPVEVAKSKYGYPGRQEFVF